MINLSTQTILHPEIIELYFYGMGSGLALGVLILFTYYVLNVNR